MNTNYLEAEIYIPRESAGNWNPNRIVLFYSDGCEPCTYLKPLIEEISEEMNLPIEYVLMDDPNNESHAKKYKVSGWPTMFVIKNNRIVNTLAGYDLEAGAIENKKRYFDLLIEEFSK